MKIVYFENKYLKGAKVYPFLKEDDPSHSAGYIEAQSSIRNPQPEIVFNIALDGPKSLAGAAHLQAAIATAMAIASDTAMELALEQARG